MILYNMRYRGAYEYDKFTLNILQIANAVSLSEMHELNENASSKEALLAIQKEINEVYKTLLGSDEKMGLTEKLYLDSFLVKGD